MTKKVLVSNIMMLNERPRFDAVLRERGYVPVWPEVKQFLARTNAWRWSATFDGWLAGDDRITRKVLTKALPALKVISKWGTGIDSIDLAAAKELGVPVCNSPGAFSDAVAEVGIGYVLMLARDLGLTDRAVRRGEWPKPRSRELPGQTLGMIGLGAIGRGIARRAQALGMTVVFHDPFVPGEIEEAGLRARPVSLDLLARESDFVCLACNLTAENRHLVNTDFLAKMKPTAFLVNVSRGPLVDEPALTAALTSGQIAGAGLDVFESEPLPRAAR